MWLQDQLKWNPENEEFSVYSLRFVLVTNRQQRDIMAFLCTEKWEFRTRESERLRKNLGVMGLLGKIFNRVCDAGFTSLGLLVLDYSMRVLTSLHLRGYFSSKEHLPCKYLVRSWVPSYAEHMHDAWASKALLTWILQHHKSACSLYPSNTTYKSGGDC